MAALAIDSRATSAPASASTTPPGERVGTVSHVRNLEYLIVWGPDRAAVDAAFGGAPAPALSASGTPQRQRSCSSMIGDPRRPEGPGPA